MVVNDVRQLCFFLFSCCLFVCYVRGDPVDLIFQNQAGDKIKLGDLSWEQGENGPGYPVKVSAVKKDCTKKTLGLLRVENSELEFCDGDEWRIVVTKADNSPENPGSTCREIKRKRSKAGSGVYWLDPNGGDHSDAFQAFCDMKSFGGGWTMCYTANNLVRLTAETSSTGIGYGTNGYRSNCNNIPFTEIMFVDEANQQRAYFSRSSGGQLVANGNYGKQANTYGLWDGHGVASTGYQYQLGICDHSFYSGFMVSGYTNCYKKCNSWCGDTRSDYYRTASTSGSYAGVAFKTNGHKPVPQKIMSVGLR